MNSCLVVDDHAAVVLALAHVLTEEGFGVITAHRGDEALAKLADARPEIAVIGAKMAGLTGLELAQQVHADLLPTAIVVYSDVADRALLADARRAGVRGFVLKDSPLRELVRAVRTVAAGGTYLDGAMAGVVTDDLSPADRVPRLTKREREVLRALAEGRSYNEIGEHLSISPATVRRHVQLAMQRLLASTATQAVATALSRSLI